MSIHYINSRLGTVTQNVKRGLLMNPGNWWHPVVTSLGRRWAILSQWAFKCENHRRKFTVFFMFQPCLIRSPESTVVGNTQSYPNHIPIISQSYPNHIPPVVSLLWLGNHNRHRSPPRDPMSSRNLLVGPTNNWHVGWQRIRQWQMCLNQVV